MRTGGGSKEPTVDADKDAPEREDGVVDKLVIIIQRFDTVRRVSARRCLRCMVRSETDRINIMRAEMAIPTIVIVPSYTTKRLQVS